MIGLGFGTGPLDYEYRDPVPDPETLPFKYFFGQLSFYLKKQKTKKNKKKKKQQQQKNKQTNKKHQHQQQNNNNNWKAW